MTKEKTIESAEVCRKNKSCSGCAYHGYPSPKCITTLLGDLVEIAKGGDDAQNATKLLTLEEASYATGVGWEEIWFDADEEEGTPEYRECFPCVFINGHYVCEDGDIGEVSPDTYNKPHHSRLWIGWEKPSDEAREAAKWDAEDERADHIRPYTELSAQTALLEHRYSGLISED